LIKIDKYIILPLNDCDWQECYFDLSWLWLTGILLSFFSETNGPIGTKLSRNVPWVVLYKVSVFRSSRIFNMAARANNKSLQTTDAKWWLWSRWTKNHSKNLKYTILIFSRLSQNNIPVSHSQLKSK
jgi:hypothetical protein